MSLDDFKEPEPPAQQSKYLQSTVDGYVYIWTPQLALRTDMKPCDELPDSFKKQQNFNEALKPADIRFMKKDEVIEEARVVFGFTFEPDTDGNLPTATDMKKTLRKLRKEKKEKPTEET